MNGPRFHSGMQFFHENGFIQRLGEIEALDEITAAAVTQKIKLFPGLDTLGDTTHSQAIG